MSCDIDVQIGRRIRVRRRLLGLTQSAVAAHCGVRFQQIQKYETATCRLSVSMMVRLAEALEAPVSYFFDGLVGQPHAPIAPEERAIAEWRAGAGPDA
jgi:transcriptional regulator with XRE-family HTH domain